VSWTTAFVLTQLLELPVYLGFMGTELSPPLRVAVAFGASALTHPLLWFVADPLLVPLLGYWGFFVVGESLVVVVEGAYLRAFGVAKPWRLALAANGFSALVGLGLQLLGVLG